MRIKLALAAGLLLIALAAAATLSHSPLVLARDNSGLTHTELVRTTGSAEACQAHEVLPSGAAAVRFGLTTVLGPEVTVSVFSGGRLLARGTHPPGSEGASVTIPIRPIPARTSAATRICVRMRSLNGPVAMLGWSTHRDRAIGGEGKPLPGRMHVEYLRPAPESWWSMASATARRLGLGRAGSGTWNALLVIALAALLIVLPSWLLTRELR